MMSQSTMQQQLITLAPAATETAAAQALAQAYANFAAQATSNGVPILPSAISIAQEVMIPALIGMSAPFAGAQIVQNAVQLFWVTIAGLLSSAFTGATAIVPPANAALAVGLQTVASANIASALDQNDACSALATVFYSQAIIGGLVTFVTPTFPIL